MSDPLKFLAGAALVVGGIIISGASFGLAAPLSGAMISVGIGLARQGLFAPGAVEGDLGFRTNALGPEDAVPIVYGFRRYAPPIADYQWRGSDNKYLYIVYTLCHAPDDGSGIEGIGDIYIDGELAINGAGAVHGGFLRTDSVLDPYDGKVAWAVHYGYGNQQVNPELQQHFPGKYNNSARFTKQAYLVLRLEADDELWAGQPRVEVEVYGLKVQDIRTGAVAFSRNPALHLYDLLKSPVYGEGAPAWELDNLADWAAEATHCDESITIPDDAGGTEQVARYEADIVMSGDTKITQRAEMLMSATHGGLNFQSGKWRYHIRRAATPLSLVIDDDMVVGARKWQMAGLDTGKGANLVFAQYIDRVRNWAASLAQYPAAGAANPYLVEDNDRKAEMTLQMPATTERHRAELMARMVLLEVREADGLQCTLKEAGFELAFGDLVTVNLPIAGPDPVPMWVAACELRQNETMGVVLMRYNADAYDDAAAAAELVDAPTDPAPNVPSRRDVVGGTGLAVAGAVQCRGGQPEAVLTATWTPSGSAFINRQYLRYRDADALGPWSIVGPLAGDQSSHSFTVPLTGTTYIVEHIEFNTYGYGPTIGGISAQASLMQSYAVWPQSVTVDLATATRTPPDGSGLVVALADRGSVVSATVDTTGAVGSEWTLHASDTAGFTPGPATEVGRRSASPGATLRWDFTPPVNAGSTYYVRVCASDCLTTPLGESPSCSPEVSAVWGGIVPGGSGGVFASCQNLAGQDSPDEWCVSGAGTIRGHEYEEIPLDGTCLSWGDYISMRAQGKVTTGSSAIHVNPAQDMALMVSGLYGFDTFSGSSLSSNWTVDAGASALSVSGGSLVFAGGANLSMRWTGAPASLVLPADEMQVAIVASWNGDASFDNRRDWLPVAGAIMSGPGTLPWQAGGHAIFTQAQVFFGDKWNYGSYESGVYQNYASPQLGGHVDQWYGVRVTPGGSTNTIKAAGSSNNWTLSATDAGNFGVSGHPGIMGWQSLAGAGDGFSIREWHAWEKPTVRVIGIPAGTTVDIIQDAKPYTGPQTVSQFFSGGGTVDLTVYDGNNRMPPFDRVILRSGSTEITRIEPPQGVYGGDEYEYQPVLVNDCVSTIRLEFLDGLGQVIDFTQADGIGTSAYNDFVLEGVVIPDGTVSIRPVQYKLGANDCSDVCVQRLMVNAGSVAMPWHPPGLAGGGVTSLDDIPDSATRVAVTPEQQAQAQVAGTNLIPWLGAGEQLMGIGELESDEVVARLDALGLAQGDVVSYGAQAKSSGGSDQLRARIEFRDAADATVGTASTGTAITASAYATASVAEVSVPAGATKVVLSVENLDGTESWNVDRQMMNRGPLALPWERAALAPGEETAGGLAADFTHSRAVTVDISADAVVTVAGLAQGVDSYLRIRIASGSGHAITLAGVEWYDTGEPTYDAATGGLTIIHLLKLGTTIYARLWGKGFTPGAQAIEVPAGDAGWDGFAPDVERTIEIPGAAEVLWVGFPPSIDTELAPPAGGAEWEGFAPDVRHIITPPAGGATWEGFPPSLPVDIDVPPGGATWQGYAPTVTVGP